MAQNVQELWERCAGVGWVVWFQKVMADIEENEPEVAYQLTAPVEVDPSDPSTQVFSLAVLPCCVHSHTSAKKCTSLVCCTSFNSECSTDVKFSATA